MLPWSWLRDRASGIHHEIRSEWLSLLDNKNLKERNYTQFLAKYPAFFLANLHWSFFVISELYLGTEYKVDFVVPRDDMSRGFDYEMIEVEHPYEPPFKSNGDKSARLNHAIDQVENWRSWLGKHPSMIKEYFPGVSGHWESHFNFTIIIGNRENSQQWLEKRNEISRRYGIAIRSFDSLTDLRRSGKHFPNVLPEYFSTEAGWLPKFIRNALANPFFETFSDKEWRHLVKEFRPVSHIIEWYADRILQTRRYNEGLSKFEAFCNTLPQELIDEHFGRFD